MSPGNDVSAPRPSRGQRTLSTVRRGTPHDLQGRFEAAAPIPQPIPHREAEGLTLFIGSYDPSSEVTGHGEWDMWFQTAEEGSGAT